MRGPQITRARPGLFAAAALAVPAAIVVGVAATSLPSISDLMITTIQPRHRRLWRAAQDKDWEFAAYELGNLQGAFKRLGEAYPTEHDISFPEMIASVTDQPFAELGNAIKAKDESGFAQAYADLTNECNSCHQALNHGAVVIRVPGGKSESDQDFTAAQGMTLIMREECQKPTRNVDGKAFLPIVVPFPFTCFAGALVTDLVYCGPLP